MSNVSLGVEFGLAIDQAFDFARADGLDNGRHAVQEIVGLFFGFQAGIQPRFDVFQAGYKSCLGFLGDLIPHEDADLIHLFPFFLQRQQRADFEVASGNVDGPGNLTPVVEIAQDFPVHIAVVHDEKLAAGLAGSGRHVAARG